MALSFLLQQLVAADRSPDSLSLTKARLLAAQPFPEPWRRFQQLALEQDSQSLRPLGKLRRSVLVSAALVTSLPRLWSFPRASRPEPRCFPRTRSIRRSPVSSSSALFSRPRPPTQLPSTCPRRGNTSITTSPCRCKHPTPLPALSSPARSTRSNPSSVHPRVCWCSLTRPFGW